MLIAAALAVATLTLTDRASMTLATRDVRVGDVAEGAGPIARVVIAYLPAGGREVVLSHRALAALIRRAVPGAVVVGENRPGLTSLRAAEPRVPRRTMRLPDPPSVQKGDDLILISRAGPVTVERAVTALQSGRNGRRLFVRDRAGHVSSIDFVRERTP